ncbi:uncharacterized protein LOC122254270 [Penaeus japonicus]|uniref:uncharacterized protein LOC122254270 n=1 Tax=Penaeus japonicus TaxID=27405 RepID=UPI001C711E07|nr:uncharacterized protein LOC122254270 [Penaeus japonicus]XP_042873808.1 uncharacterized protein LOC122254270 [Penaeus japonicus]XP_042873809.1 uncharacterized protein LOC122254270 [Penaeus japonicus]
MGNVRAGVGVAAVLLWAAVGVQGHGRLIEPPSRSSAWRYGFNTPPNYNDHEIYCGGYARQWQRNGGKCGPCGDPWDAPQPRDNEGGGKYGRGVIVKKYKHSSIVNLGVQLTANHMGYFEFRLCPHNQPNKPVTNECLDQNVLQKADGSGPRYYPGPGAKTFYSRYRLPLGLTCKQCVLQWRYVAGNNWGKCENGTGMVGCGPQEQFRSCSDITITEEDGYADETPSYVPDYDDYNEVDVETQEGLPKVPEDSANHVGHIVALTLSFLLFVLVLFGLIVYFYWARDAFKGFMKSQAGRWSKTPPPVPTSAPHKSSIITISGPIGAPPPVPPRRQRTVSGGEPALDSDQREIRSISAPTRVTINGIAVRPSGADNGISQARLHVPDD